MDSFDTAAQLKLHTTKVFERYYIERLLLLKNDSIKQVCSCPDEI